MKNPEKIAASKKPQRYPIYDEGGRIVWIRPGMYMTQVPDAEVALHAYRCYTMPLW